MNTLQAIIITMNQLAESKSITQAVATNTMLLIMMITMRNVHSSLKSISYTGLRYRRAIHTNVTCLVFQQPLATPDTL